MVHFESWGQDPSLASIVCYHVENLQEDDYDVEELFEKTSCPEEVIPYVTSLKAEGNSLFKGNDFGNALVKYSKAIKCICVAIPAICDGLMDDDNPLLKNLVTALLLNVAACALKLHDLNKVMVYCSMVLEIDNKNVKALFTRGSALVKSGKFDRAFEDLNRARSLEPNNEDIAKEFSNLISITLGKQKINVRDQGDSKEGKQSNFKPQGQDLAKEIKEESGSSPRSCGNQEELVEGRTKEIMEIDNVQEPISDDPAFRVQQIRKATFVNKRRPNLRMNISHEDMDKLSKGKELYLYHSHTNSFMKVRTFTKSDVLMKTPHNQVLREAVVSKSEFTASEFSCGADPRENLSLEAEKEVEMNHPPKSEVTFPQELQSNLAFEEKSEGHAPPGSKQSEDNMQEDATSQSNSGKERMKSIIIDQRRRKASVKGRALTYSTSQKAVSGSGSKNKRKFMKSFINARICHVGMKRKNDTSQSPVLSERPLKEVC